MSYMIMLGIKMQEVEVDAQRHQHTQTNLDGLQWLEHIVSCRFTTKRSRCNIAEHWHPWKLLGLEVAWNEAHWTMKLGVDEIYVAGSGPHWTAVFCDWVAYWCVEGACAGTPYYKYEVWASFVIRLFLLFSFAALCDRCSLYERVWSVVTPRYTG